MMPYLVTQKKTTIGVRGSVVRVRTLQDLSAAVKGRRKDRGWTQAVLAGRAGVSRPWVYEFEAGKPTAEIQHVLRVLDALDLRLDVARTEAPDQDPQVDLDAIMRRHGADD
jgi:y4mF family transcriptional regulator